MTDTLYCAVARNRYAGFSYTTTDGKKKHVATVQQKQTTWPRLAERLCQLHTVKDKHKGPYIVFAHFINASSENGEYRRVNDNIDQFYGAVLDIDLPDAPSFEETQAKLVDLGLNYVVYTTHSYDPWETSTANKYRVVVPYSRPVVASEQHVVVSGLAVALGLEGMVDAASMVLSQPMYCHAAPPLMVDEAIAECCVDGAALDVDEAYGLGEMWLADERSGAGGLGGGARKPPLPERGAALVAGERHPTFARHIAKCKREGLSWEQTLGELVIWNGSLDEPLPRDELDKMVSVWEGFERNNNAFGFDEHKARIMSAPLTDRDTYQGILRHIANSETMLDPSDRRELFNLIKSQRPGATLRLIEDEYKRQLLGVRQVTDNKVNAEKTRLAQVLQRELTGLVWLSDLGMAYQTGTGKYIKKDAFQSFLTQLWGRLRGDFIGLVSVYKGGPLTLSNVLVEHWMPIYNDIGFNPGMGDAYVDRGSVLYNTYEPPGHLIGDGSTGMVAPMLEYFTFLFPNPDDCALMLNFIAGIVQQPGRKIRYTPIIYTAQQQVGKDFFKEQLLKPLFGRGNVGEVDANYVREKYTENLTGKQLIVLQELDFGRDRRMAENTAGKMKPFITNTEVQLRRFGMAAGATIAHCANYVAFTNHFDAAFMEGSDHRYYLIKGPNERKPQQWYTDMAAWFSEHIEDCYEYFKERDISDFSFDRMPASEYTEEIRRDNARWPLNLLNEAMEAGLLEGITHLPLHWLVELIRRLTPLDDIEELDRAARLLGSGRSRERRAVIEELSKYGYQVVAERFNFECADGKKYAKQKVIQFPGCQLKGRLVERCKASIAAMEGVRVDENGQLCTKDDQFL